ncbi:outer membrane protein/peptidoglycan-associated (lipo)protein [Synechococcus sp. PCC 7502]|uniref:phosphate ABC transporter substrate-binding/OmpA family protein n=1 Tax=Synechococcus sp. PCC 7502 TaxID=1173263 RepID=UPI00029FD70E|nr:phosphate ABC transporter substrate-binding/OmpA family protein [Synechococcus sp. PCC 7502]AFY75191.1 outer membrane protein/peptidoglycan-associated (lipo)protein [Synechococcus sp. PCC 7502]
MSNRPTLALALTFLVTTTVSISGFWLVSRFFQGTNSVPEGLVSQNQGDVKLLGDTFSGYSTFRNSTFLETLKGAGIKLAYGDEFDQAKRAKLLNEGQADLLVTTLDQFIKQKPNGKIIGLIDRTVGADAVVLNTPKYPQLKSLIDLNQLVQEKRRNGQKLKITFAGDTPSEYLAFVLSTKFEAFNLTDFEVQKVSDASEAWQLLQDPKQNVAIAVIWEPFVTQARQKGYIVVLSSKDAPTTIVDVLVASNRLITSQSELLTKLLETYYRRIDTNGRDLSQLQTQIAQDGKLEPKDAAAVLQGIDFFTAIEAKRWMTDDTLSKRIGATAAVLSLAGQLEQIPTDTKGLYTEKFLSKAAENTQVLIDLVRATDPDLAERLTGNRKLNTPELKLSANQIFKAQSIGNLEVRGEVKFSSGSAQLANQSQQTLNQLAKEIGEFSPQTVAVRVIGHTSQTGDLQTNQILSQDRAQVVVDYLRRRGVKHNILAEGKGFSQLLPNILPSDARNQRTEIRLVRVQ